MLRILPETSPLRDVDDPAMIADVACHESDISTDRPPLSAMIPDPLRNPESGPERHIMQPVRARHARQFADLAFVARPEDPQVQQLVMDVYRARILDPTANTQEILAYIDQMTAARTRQLAQ